jgi:nucleoside-diphosphate-sugar epimerase
LIAFVTGATGFIGSHLVESLLKKGLELRILTRKTSSLRWLEGLPVERVFGDLWDPAPQPDLVSGLKRVDYVFHLAGVIHAPTRKEYFRINAEGTRRLLEAAVRAGTNLKKFIFISSQSAGGPSEGARGVREDDPPHPVSSYGESKLAAEREVLSFQNRFPVVILRPPTIYGPREARVLAAFKMVQRGVALKPGNRLKHVSFCYVSDLVDAVERAALQPQPNGRCYNVAGEKPCEWVEFLATIGRALKKSYRLIRIPDSVLYTLGACGNLYFLLTQRDPLFTWQKVREFVQNSWVIDGTRIREELGWRESVSLDEGAIRTAAWYQKVGWL